MEHPFHDDGVVSDAGREKYGVPKGGRWFYRQQPVLDAFRRARNTGFCVAWDKDKKTSSKMYGLFDSPESFYEALMNNPEDKRFGYEIIPQGQMCKMYFDIEWIGPQDETCQRIRLCLRDLREHIRTTYETAPWMHTVCGSRAWKGKMWKHSYHVVVHNIAYSSNELPEIREFVDIPRHFHHAEHWYYVDPDKGGRKCILDVGVYTKNRLFRLPKCCKIGTDVPLKYVTRNPLLDFLDFEKKESFEDVQAMLVTHFKNPPDLVIKGNTRTVPVSLFSLADEDSRFSIGSASSLCNRTSSLSVARQQQRGGEGGSAVANPLYFHVKQLLQTALTTHGDRVSRVGNETFKPEENCWKVQCMMGTASYRKCLMQPGMTHEKNNCLLFVYPETDATLDILRVEYQCMSNRCNRKGLRKPILGFVSKKKTASGDDVLSWRFDAERPAVPSAEQDQIVISDDEEAAGGHGAVAAAPGAPPDDDDDDDDDEDEDDNNDGNGGGSGGGHGSDEEAGENDGDGDNEEEDDGGGEEEDNEEEDNEEEDNEEEGDGNEEEEDNENGEEEEEEEEEEENDMDQASEKGDAVDGPGSDAAGEGDEMEEEPHVCDRRLPSESESESMDQPPEVPVRAHSKNKKSGLAKNRRVISSESDVAEASDRMEEDEPEGDDDEAREADNRPRGPEKEHPSKNGKAKKKKKSDGRQLWNCGEEDHNKTYEDVKKEFEKTCFMVWYPFVYAREHDDSNMPQLYSQNELKQCFGFLFYKLDGQRCRFMKRWIEDSKIRSYKKIVVDPGALPGQKPNYFNVWKGLRAQRLPVVGPEKQDRIFTAFRNHILEVVANGDEDQCQWIIEWCASLVQRPHIRTQVVVCLFGRQGCGKNIWTDFFREQVVGEEASFQTASPEHDVFGRFAPGLANKILVQIDEAEKLYTFSEKLKNAVTSKHINYEKKGKDIVTLGNYANLLITTNNANSVKIPMDDRRWVVFNCSPARLGDHAYFDALSRHLEDVDAARAVYQALLEVDLSGYDSAGFQRTRPITDYYLAMQSLSIPIVSRYLSALYRVGETRPEKISVAFAFQQCAMMARANGVAFFGSSAHFSKNMKQYPGVETDRETNVRFYHFEWNRVYKFLVDTKQFDETMDLVN